MCNGTDDLLNIAIVLFRGFYIDEGLREADIDFLKCLFVFPSMKGREICSLQSHVSFVFIKILLSK